ncbi:phospholipid transport system substrate-binding protein [Alteromonadaceae bacterium 2753L.S.0a.02]|nr:phospholipid transport system substrate-binding protein [Alteromonadaceae bacterium 2753L.S.0a.02]
MKQINPIKWFRLPQITGILAGFTLFVTAASMAEQPPRQPEESNMQGPQVVVQTVTDQLLELAKNGNEELKKDPETFYGKVEALLDPSVSFDFIAKNVMGETYWNQATGTQKQQFVGTFKRSLVETLVKGMSSNIDLNIEILDDKSQVLKNKASIVQKVSGPEGSNLVVYSLGRGKSGNWKVLNVVLDGVNLGKTFRSQFAQGVKDSKGDLQAAIDGWSAKS